MLTGMGSRPRFSIRVRTSSVPSCRRWVISIACAKGNCFIQSGLRKNSSRLVTQAASASARTSTTFHSAEPRKPWIGMVPFTLPSSMSKA